MARILIAEDDPAVRTFVSRALTHRGFHVTAVDDGARALEKLESESFDLLMTDVVMPGLDGIGLALEVTTHRPDLPVLLMTGFSAERQRAHNLDELCCRVLVKPFTLKQVCEVVESTLGLGRHRHLN